MGEIAEQKVGTDATITESQVGTKLVVDGELNTPILAASVVLKFDELAVLNSIAGKYAGNTLVQEGIAIVVGALSKLGG